VPEGSTIPGEGGAAGAGGGQPSAPGARTPEEVLFDGHPAVVGGLGSLLLTIVTLGLAAVVLWMRALGKHYRVTTQRIVIESGVFSKRLEQIDLYRVTDYVVERPFGQRLLGTGNIVIQAMDKTTPEVRIGGIRADVVGLYERLRAATEVAKQRSLVRVVDYE